MKILIVDDEPDIQTLFEQRFRKEVRAGDLEMAFAHSGEEALDYLKLHESEIVLILSDINMPGMSGFALLKHIKTKHPNPPPIVMMITAYSDKDNIIEATKLGADDFLTKPIDFTDLKEKLNRAAGG
jgi:two-component system, chemotaxis family, chemotaxis protein CheY